jgi:Hemerythrin HHE cation binding domain
MVGTDEFRLHKEDIQHDHRDMAALLADMDKALESLVCYSEVYADLKGVAQVSETGRGLAARLSEHFAQEEPNMLDAIAQAGPEFAAFSAEMKRQHGEFTARVSDLCDASRHFETSADLEESIAALKQQVHSLAHAMTVHMAAEDRKFSSLN